MTYRNSFDKIFDSIFDIYVDHGNLNSSKGFKLKSDDENYKVAIAVPGLNKEDVKISTKEGLLNVSFEGFDKTDDFVFVEKFKKTYTIPDDVEEKTISAKVENGILTITLPKTKKKLTERLISIS